MSIDKILKSICAITASLIALSASAMTIYAADFEQTVSGVYTQCAEKTEIVHFNESVNARGRLISVGLRLDSISGSAKLYLDGTGLCIDTDLSNAVANTLVTSEGERGKNDSGYFKTDNEQIHALQFYIPDSSDVITIFLDGRMIGDALINNASTEFTGLSAIIDGQLSTLHIEYVKVTDMPGTITAAFADDEAIKQLKEYNYPVVYLDEGIERTITMPANEGVDENLFSHWTDANGNNYAVDGTAKITKTTIFTAVYNNNENTYTPPVIGGLVEVSKRFFYEDFYDKDATALTVTFSPLGRTYNTVTVTPVTGKTQGTYEPQTIKGTTITTDGYVRYGIIIDEIVDADAFTAEASNVQEVEE